MESFQDGWLCSSSLHQKEKLVREQLFIAAITQVINLLLGHSAALKAIINRQNVWKVIKFILKCRHKQKLQNAVVFEESCCYRKIINYPVVDFFPRTVHPDVFCSLSDTHGMWFNSTCRSDSMLSRLLRRERSIASPLRSLSMRSRIPSIVLLCTFQSLMM